MTGMSKSRKGICLLCLLATGGAVVWAEDAPPSRVSVSRLPDIIAALSSGSEERIERARAELMAMQGEALALTLLETFAEAEHEPVRIALAEKLAAIGDAAPLPDLRKALMGSMGDEGGATAESGLRCRLGTPYCRLAGKVKDEASAPLIAKLLVEEQERAISLQKTALAAERRLGPDMVTLTKEERARAQKQADYYSGFLADSKGFQAAAIEALGRIAVPATARVLLETVLIDAYAETARRAIIEMGTAASKALLDAIDDEKLCTDCARLLGEIGDPATAEPLLRELKGADPFIRQLIIEALGKIGREGATEPIRGCLDDPYLARSAIEALGRLKDADSVPRFTKLLTSTQLRRVAAEALGRIGTKEAIQSLLSLLAGSRENKELALRALGKSKSELAVAKLLEQVSDRDTREEATKALLEVGHGAEQPLVAALASDDWPTRRNAIYLLGLIGTQQSTDKLEEIARGIDIEAVFMARAALKEIHRRSTEPDKRQ